MAKSTVDRWREYRGLPAHRMRRLCGFRLSEPDEWVRAAGADDEHNNAGGATARKN